MSAETPWSAFMAEVVYKACAIVDHHNSIKKGSGSSEDQENMRKVLAAFTNVSRGFFSVADIWEIENEYQRTR